MALNGHVTIQPRWRITGKNVYGRNQILFTKKLSGFLPFEEGYGIASQIVPLPKCNNEPALVAELFKLLLKFK